MTSGPAASSTQHPTQDVEGDAKDARLPEFFLHSLQIRGFRAIKEATLTFQPGLNVIIGANNAAKTAAIDALRLVFALGATRSGRTRSDYAQQTFIWTEIPLEPNRSALSQPSMAVANPIYLHSFMNWRAQMRLGCWAEHPVLNSWSSGCHTKPNSSSVRQKVDSNTFATSSAGGRC